MKQRHILAVLMLLVCLSIFGQQSKTVPMKGQPQKTSTQVSTNQQELILQLRAENEAMQKQLEKMEKEIELYRGDVRAKEVAINDNQGHWLTMLSIVIGAIVSILGIGLGVITPLVLNARNDKRLKDSYERMVGELKTQIDSVEKDAKSAKESLSTITGLKEDIDKIKNDIDKSKKAAERAARNAMASKLFTQALSVKNSSKAIELYSKAIELNPNYADAYLNRGYEKDVLKDLDGALKDYDKAIELAPNDAAAYNNRGTIKKEMDDREGALTDYNKAIELNPNFTEAYCNRGAIKSELNDKKGALEDHNKAIELSPDLADAYNNRADFFMSINAYDKALEDINRSIELNGGKFAYYVTRGEIYLSMERYVDALADFTQALSFNVSYNKAFEYRAICYRKLAEAEQDPAKKADLIAKAEADEQRAESLKKEDKV